MSKQSMVVVALAAAGLMGGVLLYEKINAAPSCSSAVVQAGLSAALKTLNLSSVALNDAKTVSGGVFSTKHECSADVGEIRSGVDASGMHWMRVLYEVTKVATSGAPVITATLAGDVPLAPERSTWERLRARFF
jgi:hypothetical protein